MQEHNQLCLHQYAIVDRCDLYVCVCEHKKSGGGYNATEN